LFHQSEKKRFWLKKILAFRSHFLNSLSFFSSLSSVFVGFGEKFKKSKSRQERTLKTLSLSLLHIINNFKIIIITTEERSYNTEKERE
jgi:hypothetical protein